MNFRNIARILGAILFFVALSMIVPFGVSLLVLARRRGS